MYDRPFADHVHGEKDLGKVVLYGLDGEPIATLDVVQARRLANELQVEADLAEERAQAMTTSRPEKTEP